MPLHKKSVILQPDMEYSRSMDKNNKIIIQQLTGLCALMHLLVDGICICCLYLMASLFSTAHIAGIFITYNVLAFMSQPFTGMWADRMERKHWMLLAAVLLLTLAVLATSVVMSMEWQTFGMPVVAVLLGAGNSLFHVWGGKQVAVSTRNDIRALGAFVATGAFGLALGAVFCSWPLLYIFLLSLCLLSIARLHIGDSASSADSSEAVKSRFGATFVLASVIAIMVAVMMRSFVSESFSGGLPKNSEMVLLIGLMSMLGKMAGGWIAHWAGIVRMIVMILIVLVLCFLFKNQGMVALFVGLFAVNCTMPVTLYLANVVLPGREGLAFGLLAAALIPGYLFAFVL